MNTLRITHYALAAAALASAAPVSSAPAPEPLALTPALLKSLSAEMRTNHPALRAAQSRADAALFNANGIRKWDDPMLMLGNVVPGPGRSMAVQEDGNLVYGVEQKLPLWNKPQLARAAAIADAKTRDREVDAAFQYLRRDLAKALLRAALADRTAEIVAQDLTWFDTLIPLAEERLRAGAGTQADVVLLQNERSRRVHELHAETNKLAAELSAVNRALGRDVAALWPGLVLPALADPMPYRPALADLACRQEPRLKVIRDDILAAEAMARSTRAMRKPDVTAGMQTRQFSGNLGYREAMVSLKFNLPWGNRERYRSDVLRDEAKARALEHDLADGEAGIREEVFRLTTQLDSARREALVYRDEVTPRTEAALGSARTAWEAGRGMARDVIDLRRMLLEAQVMIARATAEQHQMFAELVLCCGLGDFTALERYYRTGKLPSENEKEQP